jgi:4-alpha-glucanotransferase
VAGVPPDYFSELGQFWGNPLYDWRAMQADGFGFWRGRVRHQLARCDVLRIDHFRALAAHWAIPAGAPDARTGSWQPTPGAALLEELRRDHGDLPIVAEDLGVITPDVDELLRFSGLPGMRVLQFAFGGDAGNPHLPFNHERNSVVYTGTHDNDTSLGWYESLGAAERASVDEFLCAAPGTMPWPLIRAALGSVGLLALMPVQDLLALGTRARFNTPGTVEGNWSWKLPSGALTPELAQTCGRLVRIFGRAA